MQAIYHTTMDELSVSFIKNLKKQFANSKVDIIVKDLDETDYLNSSSKNKQYLEEAIQEVIATKLIKKTPEELNLWLSLLSKEAGMSITLGKKMIKKYSTKFKDLLNKL